MILTAIFSMLSTGEIWNPVDLFKVDIAIAACLADRRENFLEYPTFELFRGGELTAYDQAVEIAFGYKFTSCSPPAVGRRRFYRPLAIVL